jgi:hypothetical protein
MNKFRWLPLPPLLTNPARCNCASKSLIFGGIRVIPHKLDARPVSVARFTICRQIGKVDRRFFERAFERRSALRGKDVVGIVGSVMS